MNEEYQQFIENEDNANNNEDNNNVDNNIDNNNNEVEIDMEVENDNQYEYEYNQNNDKNGEKFYNDYDLSKIEVNKTQPSYSSEIQSSEISENTSSVLIYDGNEY
jgi:hypothetical protein